MDAEKITSPLAESVRNASADSPMDVIVELATPEVEESATADRSAKIAARKQAFSKHAAPVVEAIRRLGGEVTGEAWINCTLRARLSPDKVPELSDESRVARLDVPRRLKADAL